ncbi:hypothetical protein WJX73_010757 [Symbiochloris irregularis]|uniref:Ribosomal protein eL8/eL30/eS12/Gadd45 domain-containing protein n=1 Tax=Symbiochloris irregularis TaxID=706552 RepID=A0AAW1P081_9CHLO
MLRSLDVESSLIRQQARIQQENKEDAPRAGASFGPNQGSGNAPGLKRNAAAPEGRHKAPSSEQTAWQRSQAVAEAQKSRVDALTGNLSTEQPGAPRAAALTLGDVMQIKRTRPPVERPAAPVRFSQHQLRQVRGLLKAHPTKEALAAAIKKRMASGRGSKKLSRLKRIILQERLEKAAVQAAAHASSLRAAHAKLGEGQAVVLQQLQAAEAALKEEAATGQGASPATVMQTQVLQLALAEADQKLQAAGMAVEEAEALARDKAAQRARLVPASMPGEQADSDSESDEPDFSIESAAAVSPQKARAASNVPAAGERPAPSTARGEQQLWLHDPSSPLDPPSSPDVGGLDNFEDVLATWLHASHEQHPGSLSRVELGASWAADADQDAALEAGAAARALSAALPTMIVDESSAAEPEDDSSGSDGDLSPEGWNNVLAAWMEASGLTQAYSSPLEASVPSVRVDSSLPSSSQPTFTSEFPTISQPSPTVSSDLEGRSPPTILDPLYSLLNQPMTQPSSAPQQQPEQHPETSSPPPQATWVVSQLSRMQDLQNPSRTQLPPAVSVVPPVQLQACMGLPTLPRALQMFPRSPSLPAGLSRHPEMTQYPGQYQDWRRQGQVSGAPANVYGQALMDMRSLSLSSQASSGQSAGWGGRGSGRIDPQLLDPSLTSVPGTAALSSQLRLGRGSRSVPPMGQPGYLQSGARPAMLQQHSLAPEVLREGTYPDSGSLMDDAPMHHSANSLPNYGHRTLGGSFSALRPPQHHQHPQTPTVQYPYGHLPIMQQNPRPYPTSLGFIDPAVQWVNKPETQFPHEGPSMQGPQMGHHQQMSQPHPGMSSAAEEQPQRGVLDTLPTSGPGAAVAGPSGSGGGSPTEEGLSGGMTYVGAQAQCRNYCKQVITTELNRVVGELLQQLLAWQERQKALAPLKLKKRLVSGLREVAKAVRMRKVQAVVVAPNIEQIESEGGLDDLLASILEQAEQNAVPVVFALSRKKLGQVFGCRKKMSAIAILDAGGAEELYGQMQGLAAEGRAEWQQHHSHEEGESSDWGPAAASQLHPGGGPGPTNPGGWGAPEPPELFQMRRDGRLVPTASGFARDLAARNQQQGLQKPHRS